MLNTLQHVHVDLDLYIYNIYIYNIYTVGAVSGILRGALSLSPSLISCAFRSGVMSR